MIGRARLIGITSYRTAFISILPSFTCRFTSRRINLERHGNFPKYRLLTKYQNYLLSVARTVNSKALSSTTQSTSLDPTELTDSRKPNNIEDLLTVPLTKFNQLGYVNISDLEILCKSMEEVGDKVTAHNIGTLVHLTLKAVEHDFHPSSTFATRIWNFVSSIEGYELPKTHIRDFLKMSISSECQKLYEDILAKNDKSVFNDQEMGELVLFAMAQHGQIDAIETFISDKVNKLIMNETIHSAFIKAHSVNRNQAEVTKAIDDLKANTNIIQTNISFSEILIAFIHYGDLVNLKLIVDEIKDAGVKLEPKQLEAVVIAATINDKSNTILDYVLEQKETLAESCSLEKVILKLIHLGYPKKAVHMLLEQKNKHGDTINATVYINELVRAEMDIQEWTDICLLFQENNIHKYTLNVALVCALTDTRIDVAWMLLKLMQQLNEPIREHYFWPLLAAETHRAQLLNHINGMVQMNVTPSFDTLRNFVLPNLPLDNMDDVLSTIQMLDLAGISQKQAITPILCTMLSKENMLHALEVATHFNGFSTEYISLALSRSWHANQTLSIKILGQVLSKLSPEDAVKDWTGNFLLQIISSRKSINLNGLELILKEMKKYGLKISENVAQRIPLQFAVPLNKNCGDTIHSLIDDSRVPITDTHQKAIGGQIGMNIEELEGHLVELKEKGFNTRGVLRKLLILHGIRRNKKRVAEITQECLQEGKILSAGMQANHMYSFVSHGDVEGAMQAYYILTDQHPNFNIDTYKILDMCELLVIEGKSEDAMTILSDYLSKTPKDFHHQVAIVKNCHKLLKSCVNVSYGLTKDMCSVLIEGGVAQPTTIIMGPIIESLLFRDNLAGAVQEAEEIFEKHYIVAMRVRILSCLFQKIESLSNIPKDDGSNQSRTEDVSFYLDLVEQMMNLISRSRGIHQAKHDLLFASVEAGCRDEAARLINYIKVDLDQERFYSACQRFSKQQKIAPLKLLLSVSKNSQNVDRLQICQALINIYYVQNLPTEGLELWKLMREERIKASTYFLRRLHSLCPSYEDSSSS